MDPIPVRLGSTYIKVKIDTCHPVYSALQHLLLTKAAIWDFNPRFKRRELVGKFFTYSFKQGVLRLPIGYLELLTRFFEEQRLNLDIINEPLITPKRAHFVPRGLKVPRDDQLGPIEFLSQDMPGRRGLELQTGKGKTFIAIQAATRLNYVTMIVCSGLVDQWVDMINEYLVDPQYYIIQTFKSLADLVKSTYQPEIFVCSLETLRLYCQCATGYDELPYSYDRFFEHYGVGVKIVDEVHENYQAVAHLDLYSRIPINIYMSATFRRARSAENMLFTLLYPHAMRYGGIQYDKYTFVSFYGYQSGVPERKTVTMRGYNHARFEAHLFKTPTKLQRFFNVVIVQCLQIHFINIRNPGEKALIYFSTIQMCQIMRDMIAAAYPQLVVKTFISDDSEENYADGVDIIVSIPKKSATGRDISKLRTVINTVSTQASVLIEQMLGRLRKIPGVQTHFVSVFDEANPSQVRHNETQRDICIPRSAGHYIGRLIG